MRVNMKKFLTSMSLIVLVWTIITIGVTSLVTAKTIEYTVANQIKNLNKAHEKAINDKDIDIKELKSKLSTEVRRNTELREEFDAMKKKLETTEKKVQEISARRTQINTKYAYATSRGAGVPSMPVKHVDHLIKEANKYGLDPDLILNMIDLESNYVYNAKNGGYGQFLSSTAKSFYEKPAPIGLGHGKGSYQSWMRTDPYINISLTCVYMNYLMNTRGHNIEKALLGYNGNAIGTQYYKIINAKMVRHTGKTIYDAERLWKQKNL